MLNTIKLKELRPELPDVIKSIDTKLDRFVVTKHGRPVAVMLSVDDYEGLLETLEILSDRNAVKRIKKAKEDIRMGKTIPLEKLKERIEKYNV